MAKSLEEIRKFNKKRNNEYTVDFNTSIDYNSPVTEAYIKRLAQLNESKPVGTNQQALPVRGSAARDLTSEQRQKLQGLLALGGINTDKRGESAVKSVTDNFMEQFKTDTSPDNYMPSVDPTSTRKYYRASMTDAQRGTNYSGGIEAQSRADIAQGITDKKQQNLTVLRDAYASALTLQDPVLIDKAYKELKAAEAAYKEAESISKPAVEEAKTISKENKAAEFTYNYVTSAQGNADYDTVSEKGKTADSGRAYTGYNMDTVQNKVRYYENNRQQIIDDLNMTGAINIYERWDYLTEDEKKAYDYMIGSGQYQKAEEFLDGMDRTLQYRQEKQIAENIEKEEGINKHISAFAYGTAGGIGDAIGNIMTPVDRLMGKDVTENVNTTAMQEVFAESEVKGLRFMNSIGQTLGNMLPAMALGAVGGTALSQASMFMNSAGSAYREAKETGARPLECVSYALISGAAEVFLQNALGGIAQLGSKGNVGKIVSEAIKKVTSKVANQKLITALVGLGDFVGDAAGEGLEEYLQTIITPVLQNQLLDANNEITLTSPEQLEAALSGALFSAVFNGISLAGGANSSVKEGRDIEGARIRRELGGAESVIAASLSMDPDSYAYKNAQKLIKKGIDKITDTDIYWQASYVNDAVNTLKKSSTVQNTVELTEQDVNYGKYLIERSANATIENPVQANVNLSLFSKMSNGPVTVTTQSGDIKITPQSINGVLNNNSSIEDIAVVRKIDEIAKSANLNPNTGEYEVNVKNGNIVKTVSFTVDNTGTMTNLSIDDEIDKLISIAKYQRENSVSSQDNILVDTKNITEYNEANLEGGKNNGYNPNDNGRNNGILRQFAGGSSDNKTNRQILWKVNTENQNDTGKSRISSGSRAVFERLSREKGKEIVYNRTGSKVYAINRVNNITDYTPSTNKAIELYKILGLSADEIVVIDGAIEEFAEGVNPQNIIYHKGIGGHLAGKVFVYNDVDTGYEEIAPHEMYHYFDAKQDEKAIELRDTIQTSLIYDSAEFIKFVNRISEHYYGDAWAKVNNAGKEFDFFENYNTFFDEGIAFISGYIGINGGKIPQEYVAMFKDADSLASVEQAWHNLFPSYNQFIDEINNGKVDSADADIEEARVVTPFTAKDYTNEEARRLYTDSFIEQLADTLDISKNRLLDKKGGMITALVDELSGVEYLSDVERLSLANKLVEGIGFSSYKQQERAVKSIYEDIGILQRRIRNYKNAVGRETERINKRTVAGSLSVTEMDALYKGRSTADNELRRVQRKNPLTSDGKAVLKDILAGRRSIESIEELTEAVEIKANYDAEIKLREIKQRIQDYNISRKAKRYAKAAVLTEASDTWRDKKLGLSYSAVTLERNFEDISKDHELAKRLEREYVTPIKKADAEITRRTNGIVSKIKDLKISQKQTYKFDNFYQHLVDFYFENGTTETKSIYEKQVAEYYGVKNLSELGSRMLSEAELVQLYGEGIISEADIERIGADKEKIKTCTAKFKEVYNQLFTEVNRAYISNGYEPMNYIENYFPHYRKETTTNWLKKYVRETLGFDGNFNAEWNNLSTDIAGTTDTFKPGRKFFAHALHREGDITSYDCLEGMQSYLDTALNIIYHTDNIQNLRALEGQLRYKYSNEGVKARLAEINNNTELDEAQRQKELEGVYMESDSQLSNFVQELRRYTDRLAGKKSADDRPAEYLLSRPMYKVMNKLSGNVAGNMIGASFGTALTNLAPLTLATGEINTEYLLRGINDSAKNKVQTDNLMARSDFYTVRKGAEQITVSAAQKISDALSKPAEFTDLFTVEAVFRGKYYQNIARGFTDAEAIADADRYCSQLFADRNKNVMPTMWHATNPFTKLVTMFQLEVNNQWQYVFKDMPRNLDKNKGAFAWSLVQILIASWIANKAKEELTGYGGLWDPIGLIDDTINDFADTNTSTGQDIYNLGNNILDQLPFVSAFTGGGRVPVLSILPEGEDAPATLDAMKAIISGNGNAKQVQEIITNIIVPSAYVLNPLGGAGQLKKSWQGITTVIKGGEIGYNAKGEPYYKYVLDNDTLKSRAGNYIQGGIFGKSALSEAQDYYDGNTGKLSPEQTAALQRLKEIGAGTYKVSQVMQTVNNTDASRNTEGEIIDSRAENVINYVKDTDLKEREKEEVIYSSGVLSDEVIEDLHSAEEYDIPAMTFYNVYLAKLNAESDKDVNGKTVANSKSIYIRKTIDDVSGLTDEQRMYLYELMGVNKTVSNASDFDLQMIYAQMQRQKDEAERRKSVGLLN